jgi:VanZ family protein
MTTNKKRTLTISKFRFWIPALIMAGLIFFFSSQPGEDSSKLSGSLLHEILLAISRFFPSDPNAEPNLLLLNRLEFLLRKTAHVTEYTILYLTVLLGLSPRKFSRKRWALTAFLITVCYACTDEFHQYFVLDRSARITDVIIDSIGSSIVTLSLIASTLFKKNA